MENISLATSFSNGAFELSNRQRSASCSVGGTHINIIRVLTGMGPEDGFFSVIFGFQRQVDVVGMSLNIGPIMIFKIEPCKRRASTRCAMFAKDKKRTRDNVSGCLRYPRFEEI
jgi:hypothetical protein